MCARFALSCMPAMYRLHVCVDLSLDPSGRSTEIGFLDGCTFVTVVPGRKKCPVAPASAMASYLVICIIDVDYAVSICLLVRFLMIIVLSSPSSVVASRANLLVVSCMVRYNELTLVDSIYILSILPDLGPVSPNCHPLHCCCWCCCFQVYCLSITQFDFISC